ncbi:M14 family zinc carboxypeptidase [Marinicauda sp. Alg238-R41]|uniref:M14 family zinc carboxypeptidase n=1 Tax=Marinicauda sp. Alg238-R41 TaxID=2993447 RepID=UPI0022E36DC0|nr:M14 family zinc carboxypeptidase [Marinicauda sp. Alg238-R41]
MKQLVRAGLGLCLLAGVTAPASAEPIGFFQVEGVRYDSAIPTPEEVFGFEIGERPVRHSQMVDYLRQLAELSDRIDVETIGYSHEHRPILFFTITSPDNHANLDEIRETHLERRLGEAEADAAPMPIWLNYGVHGAESAGMDAAIPLLYHYAAADDEAVAETLDEAVLLVTAIFNPDGHTRRIDHVNTFWGYTNVSDPDHAQHDLWTKARTNHYWFDLNRQWLLLTQPEPQAWIRKWHEWKPMVSADFHEMGTDSPFYFHPGEPARMNPLIPDTARELTLGIAQHHVEWLDSEARLYTSEQGFDNFYIGKGSTYPQVNGSLGILFEIGAARGGEIESERGLVSHADNVRTHFRTSLTTVQGSLAQREAITDFQRGFFEDVAQLARQDSARAYVFSAPGDASRAARFIELLTQHDIAVNTLARDVEVDGRTYAAADSFVVDLNQAQYRMIRGLFDRLTEFEENIFYDVSGWTLPLAYDLDYAPLGGQFSANLVGDAATGAMAPAVPPRASYGYVFSWTDSLAPRALYSVLDAGLFARVATEPFEAQTTDGTLEFARGSVFVPLARQDMGGADIHELVRSITDDTGIRVHAVTSGFTPTSGADFGAADVFRTVERPEVLVLFDDGLASYDAGEVWWTLDYRMRVPVTLRQKDDLGGLDWSRYTHMVLVGGNAALSESATGRVNQWITEQGGTLIATRQGALWAQSAILGLEAGEDGDAEAGESGEAVPDETRPERLDFADMGVRDAEHIIGGALFETDIDITNPIGYGLSDRQLAVNRNMTATLTRPEGDPYAVVSEYTDAPLLSGYASDRRIGEIAGTPAVVARRHGQGSVVLIADNPVFRGTYAGSERVLTNAIFLSGLLDRPFGDYEE